MWLAFPAMFHRIPAVVSTRASVAMSVTMLLVVVTVSGCGDGGPAEPSRVGLAQVGSPPVDVADLPGRIVVLVDGLGVVVRNPDGSGEVVLDAVDGPSPAQQPTWSPDGRRVAWASFDSRTSPAVRIAEPGVEVDPGGSDGPVGQVTVRALPTAPFYFDWAPDGSRLAWLGPGRFGVSGGIVDTRAGVAGMPLVLVEGRSVFVDWLPDSSGLVAHVDGARLETSVPGSPTTLLHQPTGPFGAPEVLPDGRIVVIGGTEVPEVMSISHGGAHDKAQVRLEILGAGVGQAMAESEVVAVIDGSPARFDVDPTGSRVAVWSVLASGTRPMVVVDLATGSVVQVLDDGAFGGVWSPDGSTLAAVRRVDDDRMVWSVWNPADGPSPLDLTPFTPTIEFAAAYLPFFDQYARAVTPWSPDGRAFVHTRLVGPDSQVVVQPVRPVGGLVVVGEGDVAWWSPGQEFMPGS